MSRIQTYQFGKIEVDSSVYTEDVIIFPDSVISSWWRKEGHLLLPEDMGQLRDILPAVLVVGQGKYGRMKISNEMHYYLNELDIELKSGETDRAVVIYNDLWEKGFHDIIGAFHLTC